MKPMLSVLLGVLLLAGCTSYEARPVDWEAESVRLAAATGTVELASLADVALLARIGNPELNALRLKAANGKAVARETGWWEDPSLDIDLNRIVQSSSHPFLGGATLSFTIPLSGAPAFDAHAAEAYAQADALEVIAAETATAAEAQDAFLRLASARRKKETLEAFLADRRQVQVREQLARLADRGEVSRMEVAADARRLHARRHRLMEAHQDEDEARADLTRLLGLAPGMEIRLGSVPTNGWTEAVEGPSSPLDFTRHPRVLARMARLGGSEDALQAEIRRQYPDLKFGPGYSREDGQDRVGIVAGVNIPIWNRNRKAVAEATGTRDEKRLDALQEWEAVVREESAARRRLMRLREHVPAPAAGNADGARLLDIGEIGPAEFLAQTDEMLDAQLDELDWRRDVARAQVAWRALCVPQETVEK